MGSITVNQVGKAYKQYANRWSRIAEWLSFGRIRHYQLTWVLKDISLKIEPGESVGLIGVNGAGKSTLLKMIAGTTLPTDGEVKVNGTVAAILELGMGFHPDFTGRQNVLMYGKLLGYTDQDLVELMPEIEAFAEIGEYIDQPVRIYSSGMQMRLAFSVATVRRPDVLIVDEALSVGDTYFQHKSFDKIREFRELGTTLLIVSHDKGAIQTVCDRAILLNRGNLAMQGDPETVFDYYNALLSDHQNQKINQVATSDVKARSDSGTFEAEIVSVRLFNTVNQEIEVVSVAEPVIAEVAVVAHKDLDGLVLGFGVKDRFGQMVFGTNTYHTKQKIQNVVAGSSVTFYVSFSANLGVGTFSINCSLVENASHIEKNYHWVDRAMVFEVINADKPPFVGYAWNSLDFDINVNERKNETHS